MCEVGALRCLSMPMLSTEFDSCLGVDKVTQPYDLQMSSTIVVLEDFYKHFTGRKRFKTSSLTASSVSGWLVVNSRRMHLIVSVQTAANWRGLLQDECTVRRLLRRPNQPSSMSQKAQKAHQTPRYSAPRPPILVKISKAGGLKFVVFGGLFFL